MFGNVKERTPDSSKHFLPVVKTFSKWNSFDYISGTKTYITNGLDDLKIQIHQDIMNAFPLSADQEPRMLTQDMHSSSQMFTAELCGWMDTLYQELHTTSEATKD